MYGGYCIDRDNARLIVRDDGQALEHHFSQAESTIVDTRAPHRRRTGSSGTE
jgi:hypothetical protein